MYNKIVEQVYANLPGIIKRFLCKLAFPQLTTAERLSLSGQCPGRVVFDSTLKKVFFWTGTAWEQITSI